MRCRASTASPSPVQARETLFNTPLRGTALPQPQPKHGSSPSRGRPIVPRAGPLKPRGTSRLSSAPTRTPLPNSPGRPILSTSSILANHAGPVSRSLYFQRSAGLSPRPLPSQSNQLPALSGLRPIHAPHSAARPTNPGLKTSGRMDAGRPFNADCLANWGFRVATAAANRRGARCRRGEVRPEYPSAFLPPSLSFPASRRSLTASFLLSPSATRAPAAL